MAFQLAYRRFGRRFVLGVPLALAASAACSQDSEIQYDRSPLTIVTAAREIKFDVEMALTEAQREHGLMFRQKLGPYEGMLFDFYREQKVSFWMKNTLIPLDMLFIAADGTIKHIYANAKPLSTDTISSEYPVRAVLEVNGGTAALLGIKTGDKAKHPIFGNA